MPFALMLAMQAAGMVTDWIGTRQQQMFADMGAKVQQAGIESNIELARLESEDESVNAMKQLRQTLGSQIAVFAARGTATNAGSASSILNESVGNFNADERSRKINLLSNLNKLNAEKTIGNMTQMSANAKMWNSFASRSFSRFPTSVSGWKAAANSFAEGFGLSSVGS